MAIVPLHPPKPMPRINKALQTRYKGYNFRSRTEARWAVFFDTLGIRYDYEPQGYRLDGNHYLPDFWLPGMKAFIEIKGTSPTEAEISKACALAKHTKHMAYIMTGPPGSNSDENYACFPGGGTDMPYEWCECPICSRIGLAFYGYNARLCNCNEGSKYTILPYGYYSRVDRAVVASRSARFEFGESGAT